MGRLSRKKRPGLLVPGHNYVGPGNPLDNAPPVDNDDTIARLHDEDYARGESVAISDDIAIQLFADEARKGALHAIIGAAGLSLKRILELGFGTLYDGKTKGIVQEKDIRDAVQAKGGHYPHRDLIDQVSDPKHPDHEEAKVRFNTELDHPNPRDRGPAKGNELIQRSPPDVNEDYRYLKGTARGDRNYAKERLQVKRRFKNWIEIEKRLGAKNSKYASSKKKVFTLGRTSIMGLC